MLILRKSAFITIALCLIISKAKAQSGPGGETIKVRGEVSQELSLSVSDLEKMKTDSAVVTDHNGRSTVFTGVKITDILEAAGATTRDKGQSKNLTRYVLVKCKDDYRVIFSLVELDSGYVDKKAILAYRVEGKSISPERGPFRLIVSGEKKPARSAYQVSEFIIGSVKEN